MRSTSFPSLHSIAGWNFLFAGKETVNRVHWLAIRENDGQRGNNRQAALPVAISQRRPCHTLRCVLRAKGNRSPKSSRYHRTSSPEFRRWCGLSVEPGSAHVVAHPPPQIQLPALLV